MAETSDGAETGGTWVPDEDSHQPSAGGPGRDAHRHVPEPAWPSRHCHFSKGDRFRLVSSAPGEKNFTEATKCVAVSQQPLGTNPEPVMHPLSESAASMARAPSGWKGLMEEEQVGRHRAHLPCSFCRKRGWCEWPCPDGSCMPGSGALGRP